MKIMRKVILFVLLIFAFIYLATSIVIGNEVNRICEVEKERYSRDCVSSLIKLVDDRERSYRERNQGIWALGQMGDERAKGVLYRYLGNDYSNERGSYETEISQYEISKAIRLVEGGVNLTSWVWR